MCSKFVSSSPKAAHSPSAVTGVIVPADCHLPSPIPASLPPDYILFFCSSAYSLLTTLDLFTIPPQGAFISLLHRIETTEPS